MQEPSREEKVSSWIDLAFIVVVNAALIVLFAFLIALISGGLFVLFTPQLNVPYWGIHGR